MNAPSDYRRILVGTSQVGLIGLNEIFEELKPKRGEPDSLLGGMLVERAGIKNYIPPSSKDTYQKALLREFRKFLGEKVTEDSSGFLEVAILGPGCYSCNRVEQDVMAVLSETGIQAAVNHISDPNQIAEYGMLPTPALIINGKVKSKGTVPSKSMIKKWLEEAKG